MVSNRVKGNRTELKAQKELEDDGWLVQRAPPTTKWKKQVDLFGLFDILALKKGGGPEELPTMTIYSVTVKQPARKRFIQVKTNRFLSRDDILKMTNFKLRYLGHLDSVEWWCWWERGKHKTKRGWEKIII